MTNIKKDIYELERIEGVKCGNDEEEAMNDIVRHKLQYIITHYGRSVCDEPKRCEGLLRDLCPEYRREVNVLVSALKERVAAELMTASDALPKELILERLIQRLYDNLGMAEEFARWAVESWAISLGFISGTMPVTSVPKAKKRKPSVKGLSELFAPKNRLSSGLSFDEETYAKAKPHFEAAWEHAKQSGYSIKELIEYLASQFGTEIRPYLKQFLIETRETLKGETAPEPAKQETAKNKADYSGSAWFCPQISKGEPSV